MKNILILKECNLQNSVKMKVRYMHLKQNFNLLGIKDSTIKLWKIIYLNNTKKLKN